MDKVTVYDNGGKTFDRYTVQIGRDVYGMSDNATSPAGFNQYAGSIKPGPAKRNQTKLNPANFGKRVRFSELPEAVRIAIVNRQG